MQAAAISEHNDKFIKDQNGGQFLQVSAIYGPDGGGKSNVLGALRTLASKILRPLCATCDKKDCDYKARKVPVEPSAFTEENRNMPTEFEIFFQTKTAEYRYILHIRKEIVIYESLDRVKTDTGRCSALVVRERNKINLKGTFGKFNISEEVKRFS